MVKKFPSLIILLFVISGILIADWLRVSSSILLILLVSAFLLGFYFFQKGKTVLAKLALVLCIFFFSAFHLAISYYDPGAGHISKIITEKQRYHVFGEVSDWPLLRSNRTEIKIAIDSIISDKSFSVSGDILLKISDTTTSLQRGDKVEFYGRIYPVKERVVADGFDYHRFLQLRGIYGIVYLPTVLDIRMDRGNSSGLLLIVDKMRKAIIDVFNQTLTPNAAALASGFLIGETRNIPVEIYKRFRDSGTLHLLAVSGSNVAMVLLFFVMLLRAIGVSRNFRSFVLMVIILFFCLISYAEPSVIRASLMASLVILAGLLQRRIDLNNIIALTALIILLVEPSQFFEVGFQLSFATAWGLIYFVPRLTSLNNISKKRWHYRFLFFPLIVALTAQVVSAPIILFYFKKIPLLSVISNILIIPLVSLAVYGILLVLIMYLILPMLGSLIGGSLNSLMNLIISLLETMGGDSALFFSYYETKPYYLVLYFFLLVVFVQAIENKKYRRLLVISILLISTWGLSAGVYSSVMNRSHISIVSARIPGGLITVVKKNDESTADLIFSNISGRDYRVEEVILYPILENLEVREINNIFVLNAQFNAIDDIYRLAESYAMDEIFVRKSLKGGFLDQLSFGNYSIEKNNFNFSGESNWLMNSPGYYFENERLVLRIRSHFLIFESGKSDLLNNITFPGTNDMNLYVVTSKSCSVSELNLTIEKNQNIVAIICAKIEQQTGDRTPLHESTTKKSTVKLVSLTDNPVYRIEIY